MQEDNVSNARYAPICSKVASQSYLYSNRDSYHSSFSMIVVLAMMIGVYTVEDQLVSLTKTIGGLNKCIQELDAKLFKLTNKMNSMTEGEPILVPLKFSEVQ